MSLGLIGTKLGMTTVFNAQGQAVAVTVLEIKPNRVAQVKKAGRDGYDAVQLAAGEKTRAPKAYAGHAAKAGIPIPAVLKEFRNPGRELNPGDALDLTAFEGVTAVDVSSVSKGRGFAGVIKRWGFSRGPKTHGCKAYRRPKSSGPSTTPSEVRNGKRMPGHMGAVLVTTRNLKVVNLDAERSLLLVKGATPGPTGGRVVVYPTGKRRRAGHKK